MMQYMPFLIASSYYGWRRLAKWQCDGLLGTAQRFQHHALMLEVLVAGRFAPQNRGTRNSMGEHS